MDVFDNMEAVPIGKPFDNVKVILVDADGNEVAYGEVSEIYVKNICFVIRILQGCRKDKRSVCAKSDQ